MTISAPNPEATAAERLANRAAPPEGEPRKRGRPKGSKNKPRDGETVTPLERSEDEKKQGAALCAFLANTIWDLTAVPMANHRELTDEEANQLGAAIDPVLYKYLPGMGNWALEIALVSTVAIIWANTAPDEEEEKPKGTPVAGGSFEVVE